MIDEDEKHLRGLIEANNRQIVKKEFHNQFERYWKTIFEEVTA